MNHDNRIAEILDSIEAVHTNDRLSIDWKGHYPEAMKLARELGMPPEKMAEPNCLTCQLEVLNTLRTNIGLKELRNEAERSVYRARMDVCHGNEEQGIPRCERLAGTTKLKPTFPFFQIKDANCTICGCFVAAKANVKWERCELNKWPQ